MTVNYMKTQRLSKIYRHLLKYYFWERKKTQSSGVIQGIKHGHNVSLSCFKGQENEKIFLTHKKKRSTAHPGAQVHKYNEQGTQHQVFLWVRYLKTVMSHSLKKMHEDVFIC